MFHYRSASLNWSITACSRNAKKEILNFIKCQKSSLYLECFGKPNRYLIYAQNFRTQASFKERCNYNLYRIFKTLSSQHFIALKIPQNIPVNSAKYFHEKNDQFSKVSENASLILTFFFHEVFAASAGTQTGRKKCSDHPSIKSHRDKVEKGKLASASVFKFPPGTRGRE